MNEAYETILIPDSNDKDDFDFSVIQGTTDIDTSWLDTFDYE